MKPINTFLVFLFLLSFLGLKSQGVTIPTEREKVYLQTNHVYYKPGETIFYKLNVVSGETLLPTNKSKIVRVQLIEPSGNVKYTNVHEIKEGVSSGSFFIAASDIGGLYKLKAFTNFQQNETPNLIFEKEINIQKIVSPRLLMKVDFLKKGYQPGEEVEIDFSLKSLQNMPITFYEGIYSIIINGEKWKENTFLTNREGKSKIKFILPNYLKSDDALITFNFSYDGFNETISRSIPINLGKLDIKILPEGGFILGNIENTIAFKAMNEHGKPVDFKGEIVDQKGKPLMSISTIRFGMGKFTLKPQMNSSYFLKYRNAQGIEKEIPFPKTVVNNAKIEVTRTNSKPQVNILSTIQDDVRFDISFRNKLVESKNLKLNQGINSIPIDISKLPMGIVRFTLFKSAVPISERVVYINRDSQLKISVENLKQQYLPREKVKVRIKTLDNVNNPISANLGLAVVDDKLWTYADDRQNTIHSWLTLSSELSGKVEEPNFYFKKDEPQALELLDLVMLTNGYRYFQWAPKVLETGKLTHEVEQKNGIYGIVVDENNDPVESDVFLYEISSYNKGEITKKETAKDGRFYFSNINNEKSNKVIAKAKQPKQKVKIKILSYAMNSNPLDVNEKESQKDVEEIIGELKKQAEREKKEPKPNKTNSKNDTAQVKHIEEVVTIGYGIQRKANVTGSVVTVNSTQDIPTTLLSALQGHVAGIQILNANGQPGNSTSITIRGISSLSNSGKPLIIVDGVVKDKLESNMNSSEIQNVTVLKDEAATAIYGSRAIDGAIIINLKNSNRGGLNWKVNKESIYDVYSISRDSLVQFDYSREFAFPIYETTETPYRYDYRESIYWNPIIQTDKNGVAEIEFYNSDANTTFRIISEGIASNGLLGREEVTYAAQSTINIDAKIPPYLTMADEPIIPVVVKNNSKNERAIQILPIVSKSVELKPYDSIAVLKPLESSRLNVPLKTGVELNSNISIISTSDQLRETMILPFKVEKKGFVIKEEIVASQDTIINFQLKNVIEGTLKIEARMFENASTKLLTDIERLKKEPYGCFEQLSSTIYPNLFIFDYLKHFRLTQPWEKDVMNNLRTGYSKLSTYELPGGGFGYFHTSNSNIGVSAFALLEFSDLSKLIHVNPRMLERTKNYLLKQRNGMGTFEGIDYFSKNFYRPDFGWATHSYVVYSMAKNGLKNEVTKEFDLAISRVNQTKDFYQMAVLANAALELDKTSEYAFLISELNKQVKSNSMKLGTSFTGSYGNSLKAESLAFYLLAYTKSPNFNDSVASDIVNRINVYADKYGYGSSQGTTMVIQALAEYYKKTGFNVEDAKFQRIYFNDEELTFNPIMPIVLEKLAKENNKIQIISPNKKTLPYSFSYQYATLDAPKNENSTLVMTTSLQKQSLALGETNRIKVEVKNKLAYNLPMVTAKIGIPAGLTLEPAILKDLLEKKQFSYYELFDNYLVLYWETMGRNEVKTINLDVKAEFPGSYIGKNSNVYLYYSPENASYNEGLRVTIAP